ncbi:hypothetical protein QYE76_034499 [Lolium multiflorum]|uniref:Myb/SANT-like domain-containing protein n=1 Tax=Lolium multiflorum TaxID=4521 RepID=A0AAD8QZ22_LOLMU|nr:hypothetical protein QYE76_034499 [Lolium multiflorum]
MNRFSKQCRARPWRNARFGSFQRCRQISTPADAKGNFRRTGGDENGDGGSCGAHRRKRKGGREGFRHLPPRPMAYFYPLLHCPPKFQAPPPVGKQDSFCDDFNQALVYVGDSQIPSQVPDSQPTYESKITPLPVSDLVKMCGLIQSGVRTAKGFKEVDLNVVAKGLANHCGVTVCSTQVYNHLRKWRQRWLTISMLRDLSGAQWCEDTKSIVLEGEYYCGHVAPHLPPPASRPRHPPGVIWKRSPPPRQRRTWLPLEIRRIELGRIPLELRRIELGRSEASPRPRSGERWPRAVRCVWGRDGGRRIRDCRDRASNRLTCTSSRWPRRRAAARGERRGPRRRAPQHRAPTAARQGGPPPHRRAALGRWGTHFPQDDGGARGAFLMLPLADAAESDTVNLDADKPTDAPEKPTAGKRKICAFADDELVAFTNMIVAVKEAAQAIRANKPTDMHPDLYNAVMDMIGFTEDDLMVALSHLVDPKA